MKAILPLILISCLSISARAQVQPLGRDTTFLSLELAGQSGNLELQWEATNREKGSPFTWPFLRIKSAELDDADVRIVFEVVDQKFGMWYQVALQWQDQAGDALLLPAGRQKGDLGRVALDKYPKQMTWMDATENGLDFGRKYTLLLISQLWGDPGIYCGEAPVRPFPKNWPSFAVGELVGLGLIGLGHVYKGQADGEFDTYRDYWKDSQSKDASDPFLTEARNKDRTYKVLTYSGIGIASLTALMAVYRNIIRHKSKKSKYERYCHPEESSLKLEPSVTYGGDGPSVGMALTLKF